MKHLPNPASAFSARGLTRTVETMLAEMKNLYVADHFPWVVGYSGGKDSTATLQLVWTMLSQLPSRHRKKKVNVISTDTLVENPIVATWVSNSLQAMEREARVQKLPIFPHRLTPALKDRFWVNLIGRGYAAPRPKFRWCTERLKINPSNAFIRKVVKKNGEAILVLGTRKAESTVRAHNMAKYEAKRIRDKLSPNANLTNCLIYSPLEAWTNDDVWLYLVQNKNAWGYDHKALLTLYQGASQDGECPLVIDSSTPSCGSSRFGCWVCTMVEQDKSMAAMIQNDEEKEWMRPLLELRNALDFRVEGTKERGDRHLRDFRRMNGRVQLYKDRPIPGPYHQEARARWLEKVLEAQQWVRQNGPEDVSNLELITLEELHEIRRIWVVEKHEFEDLLPSIYEKSMGSPFPAGKIDGHLLLGAKDLEVLKSMCPNDPLLYELTRELLDVERRHQFKPRGGQLFKNLEQAMHRGLYDSEEDAVNDARVKRDAKAVFQKPDLDLMESFEV